MGARAYRSKHGEQTNQKAGTGHARKLIFDGDGRWQDPFLTLKLLKLWLTAVLFNTCQGPCSDLIHGCRCGCGWLG